MTDAYNRALELATSVGDSTHNFGGPLKRAEKIALAQVWASLAVADALAQKPPDQTSGAVHGFS